MKLISVNPINAALISDQTAREPSEAVNMMNVLLITVDSLRADFLGCYGSDVETPNIDSFAERGILFKEAFSTWSSTPASFSGILGSKIGLNPPVLISEILSRGGFKCQCFHSNPLLKRYGYDRGFDEFRDIWKGDIKRDLRNKLEKRIPTFYSAFKNLYHFYLFLKGDVSRGYERAETINKHGVNFLKQARPPYFVWLHYMDVHMPYYPPERFRYGVGDWRMLRLNKKLMDKVVRGDFSSLSSRDVNDLRNLYRGEIEYLDTQLAEIFDYIDFENTLVVFTSDHGEEFMEHGGLGHRSNMLVRELMHVPLIIRLNEKRKLVEERVNLLGLSPTILDILGLPEEPSFEGKTFLNIFN